MTEMTAPYADELKLAGTSLARRRELIRALNDLVRRPMDVQALARVAATQAPAIEAFDALSDVLDRDNTLEDLFGPGWAEDPGAAGGLGAAPLESRPPRRYDRGGA